MKTDFSLSPEAMPVDFAVASTPSVVHTQHSEAPTRPVLDLQVKAAGIVGGRAAMSTDQHWWQLAFK